MHICIYTISFAILFIYFAILSITYRFVEINEMHIKRCEMIMILTALCFVDALF